MVSEEMHAKKLDDIKIIRLAILDSGRTYGEMTCPACTRGRVSFEVTDYQSMYGARQKLKRVSAACSNRSCVRWME